MSYDVVKELVNQFENSDIREMNVSIEGVSLYLSKNENNHLSKNDLVMHSNKTEESQQAMSKIEEVVETTVQEVSSDVTGTEIVSPIVGVVYTASEPGKPAFVSVGDKVEKGDTLCIIEAMKLMNDVTSDVSGTITEILIENEQIVEFGQPLFKIS